MEAPMFASASTHYFSPSVNNTSFILFRFCNSTNEIFTICAFHLVLSSIHLLVLDIHSVCAGDSTSFYPV